MCVHRRPEQQQQQRGFSIIELLVVIAVIGIMATMVMPQLLRAFDRTRQRRSLADMRAIAGANATYHVDAGGYASALADLEPTHIQAVPNGDGWGNAWAYAANGASYSLTSFGLDGAAGPAAPDPWFDEPFESDLIVQSGVFTQAPASGR